MAWMHSVSDIPMKEWSLRHQIDSVAVGDRIYLFGYCKTCEEDGMQVITFHPKTFTWDVINPPSRKISRRPHCEGWHGQDG
ncbi:Protein of unknown function [Gryllus bimaculatus]|nr:Protein of unknown function [Gryllus bimaculatus]